MANGQHLPSSIFMRDPDTSDPKDILRAFKEIKRWSQTLQLGSVGFKVARAIAQSVGAGVDARIGWSGYGGGGMLQDKEGWIKRGAQFDVIVPPGLGGTYIIKLFVQVPITAALAPVVARINVNGATVSAMRIAGTQSAECVAIVDLWPGDSIEGWFFNGTAAAIALSIGVATATNPYAPSLEAWRIALPSKRKSS